MVFQGKIIVPLNWCDRSTVSPHYIKLGYAIIHDDDTSDDYEYPEPQLLQSKLYHPIFANLNLGFYAGQATAKDGCSSKINWKEAPDVAAAIREWAKKDGGVAKECSPNPSHLRKLAVQLNILGFGKAITHDVLTRVLRFVYTHISKPELAAQGKDRVGTTATVNKTIALLAREGVFDHSSTTTTTTTTTTAAKTIPAAARAAATPPSTPTPLSPSNKGTPSNEANNGSHNLRSTKEKPHANPSTTTTTTSTSTSRSFDSPHEENDESHHDSTFSTKQKQKPAAAAAHTITADDAIKMHKLMTMLFHQAQHTQGHLHRFGGLINQHEDDIEQVDHRLDMVEMTTNHLGESVSEMRKDMRRGGLVK